MVYIANYLNRVFCSAEYELNIMFTAKHILSVIILVPSQALNLVCCTTQPTV